ncbi:E2 domain-containing protein [Sphingomonas sp. 179-A 2A2 NHS]|uniref:E2 domain-containing protein n=1 Tax=Sphingomonas sp. 179-A 2A2 NHS TaxID=3374290 RepID=UPI00387A4BDE
MTATTTPETIALIADSMSDFGASEIRRSPGELLVSLPVPLADGRVPVYGLSITVEGASAVAREITPSLLPAFCPERHINRNGSFCLYWRAVDDIVIDRADAARAWWETLVRFLQLQSRAARLRRWPDGRGRAHGAPAALHQLRAELAAGRLGDPFPSDLADRRLTLVVSGGGANGPAVRVMRDGRRLYSVWIGSGRVVNLRDPCVCSAGAHRRPAVLRSCGDHANAAAVLALELHRMGEQESLFWKGFAGSPCCGSVDGCPLANAGAVPAAGASPAGPREIVEVNDNDGSERQV